MTFSSKVYMDWLILVIQDSQVRTIFYMEWILCEKVYGLGNTLLFEILNRHEAWQGFTYDPK
jgi:hypothetical protein